MKIVQRRVLALETVGESYCLLRICMLRLLAYPTASATKYRSRLLRPQRPSVVEAEQGSPSEVLSKS